MKRRSFLTSTLAGGAGMLAGRRTADAAEAKRTCRTCADRDQDTMVLAYRGRMPDLCVCDQALRVMPDGSWAIIFMTGGDGEPRKANHIAMCRSTNRGKSWSKKAPVLRYPDKACLLSEVCLAGDEIRIMGVTHGGYFERWRNVVITSKDSGKTWSEAVPFEPLPRRTFVRNLYVSTWGEWFLPYQTYDTVDEPDVSPLKDKSFRKALNGVLISQDGGTTWTDSKRTGPISGWAENNIVELRDERMVMLIRADGKGYLLRSESRDRGRTWSSPKPSDIPNPGSKFRLFRLSTGRIVLVHNACGKPGLRNPLALWASDDDMATWAHQRVITDFPGQLQYPDGVVDERDGFVHFAFDYNRHDLIYVGAKLPM